MSCLWRATKQSSHCNLELQPKRFAEHWPPAPIIQPFIQPSKPACRYGESDRRTSGRAVTGHITKKTL